MTDQLTHYLLAGASVFLGGACAIIAYFLKAAFDDLKSLMPTGYKCDSLTSQIGGLLEEIRKLQDERADLDKRVAVLQAYQVSQVVQDVQLLKGAGLEERISNLQGGVTRDRAELTKWISETRGILSELSSGVTGLQVAVSSHRPFDESTEFGTLQAELHAIDQKSTEADEYLRKKVADLEGQLAVVEKLKMTA